jgi:predicted O-methyltransferase YrrM
MENAMQEQWTAIDQYLADLLVPQDAALELALKESVAAGLPPIHVPANQGKFLQLLARMCGAKSILEIGTLGGYSTIWLARALPTGGRLITLEANAKHAQVALSNIARAGLAEVVEVRLGPALQTLPELAAEGRGPFDLVFIDADKVNGAEYFGWAVKLSHKGSVIVVDNVVRQGEILNAQSPDTAVQGMRRALEAIAREPRVSSTGIPTVGTKGYDGFVIAFVTAD